MAAADLAGLGERVRALEAIVSTSLADRRPIEQQVEHASAAAAAPSTQERHLEARAQDPVDWMALERFATRWADQVDSERTLALVGPADLARRFGPPARINPVAGGLLWTYDSVEKNAAGKPLTIVTFMVVDGCVLRVTRQSNL